MEDADKVSGTSVDWDLLQEIDLTKPENTTKEALDILFQDFYLEDKENSLTLAEFMESPFIRHLGAKNNQVIQSGTNVFGEEFVGVGAKNKKFLRIKPRFIEENEPFLLT